MIHSVLSPIVQGQPAPVAATLQQTVTLITQHITIMNLLIAVVQTEIGLFLLAGLWVRGTVIMSIAWAVIVWYGGEGMSMLLTGQGSVLTGAPGAVLLYPLLGLLVYPRRSSPADASTGNPVRTLLSRDQFRWILAGFWIFAALLQLQPYWWQQGQISLLIGNMVGQGGLNRVLLDPLFQQLSTITATLEMPLNGVLIAVFLSLGIGLAVVRPERIRPLLAISAVLSLVLWVGTQGFGMIFTGMATDFNSGLLLILMALACWQRAARARIVPAPSVLDVKQPEESTQLA